MSNNKQSSVEWFAQESWKLRIELEAGKISMGEYANKYYQLKEQAKAMHKEEVIDSFGVGCQVESTRLIGYHGMAEQYYNETYGGNK